MQWGAVSGEGKNHRLGNTITCVSVESQRYRVYDYGQACLSFCQVRFFIVTVVCYPAWGCLYLSPQETLNLSLSLCVVVLQPHPLRFKDKSNVIVDTSWLAVMLQFRAVSAVPCERKRSKFSSGLCIYFLIEVRPFSCTKHEAKLENTTLVIACCLILLLMFYGQE